MQHAVQRMQRHLSAVFLFCCQASLGRRHGDTPEKIASALLEAECAERTARSMSYRLSQAKFPIRKEFEDFDFASCGVEEGRVRDICL